MDLLHQLATSQRDFLVNGQARKGPGTSSHYPVAAEYLGFWSDYLHGDNQQEEDSLSTDFAGVKLLRFVQQSLSSTTTLSDTQRNFIASVGVWERRFLQLFGMGAAILFLQSLVQRHAQHLFSVNSPVWSQGSPDGQTVRALDAYIIRGVSSRDSNLWFRNWPLS